MPFFFLLLNFISLLPFFNCHHSWGTHTKGTLDGRSFALQPGVAVTFENPVYTNGYFLGFDGWNDLKRKYGATNATFIVRLEFRRDSNFRWVPTLSRVDLRKLVVSC